MVGRGREPGGLATPHPRGREPEYHFSSAIFGSGPISGTGYRPVVACMSSPSSGSQSADAPPGGIPPLTSSTVDGKPYLRHADVEAEILRARSRPPAEWVTLTERRGEERLPNEALVFLVRQIRK